MQNDAEPPQNCGSTTQVESIELTSITPENPTEATLPPQSPQLEQAPLNAGASLFEDSDSPSGCVSDQVEPERPNSPRNLPAFNTVKDVYAFWESRRNKDKLVRGLDITDETGLGKMPLIRTWLRPFRSLRPIGYGGHSQEIEEVRSIKNGRVFARKRVLRSDKIYEKFLVNEIAILKKLNFHHLISLKASYKTRSAYYMIILPVADGNLEEYFLQCTENCFPSDIQRSLRDNLVRWFGCLAAALRYTHGEFVQHWDLKPKNILCKGDRIFIADFGISRDVHDKKDDTKLVGLAQARSYLYCAPEGKRSIRNSLLERRLKSFSGP